MTSATSITIDDDGTAWLYVDHLVGDEPYLPMFRSGGGYTLRSLDRPCDTCGGMQRLLRRNPSQPRYVDATGLDGCDCINGRHTFPLDVECGCTFGTHGPGYPECITTGVRSLRVSVVPGMVARIVGIGQATTDTQYPFITPKVGGGWVLHHIPRAMVQRTTITLPSNVKPGGFAAQLVVAS